MFVEPNDFEHTGMLAPFGLRLISSCYMLCWKNLLNFLTNFLVALSLVRQLLEQRPRRWAICRSMSVCWSSLHSSCTSWPLPLASVPLLLFFMDHWGIRKGICTKLIQTVSLLHDYVLSPEMGDCKTLKTLSSFSLWTLYINIMASYGDEPNTCMISCLCSC